jgi:hypothetical protein
MGGPHSSAAGGGRARGELAGRAGPPGAAGLRACGEKGGGLLLGWAGMGGWGSFLFFLIPF